MNTKQKVLFKIAMFMLTHDIKHIIKYTIIGIAQTIVTLVALYLFIDILQVQHKTTTRLIILLIVLIASHHAYKKIGSTK